MMETLGGLKTPRYPDKNGCGKRYIYAGVKGIRTLEVNMWGSGKKRGP